MSRIEVEVANPHVHEKGHVEYDVVWDSTEAADGAFKTRRVRWSVKRRYRDFEALDAELRKQYGAAMSVCRLPPSRMFGNKDPSFIRERQGELQEYLRRALTVHGVTEFDKRTGSAPLRDFMEWDAREAKNVLSSAVAAAAPVGGGAGGRAPAAPVTPTAAAAAPAGGGASPVAAAAGVPAGAAAVAAAGGGGGRASLAHRRMTSRAAATASGLVPAATGTAAVTYNIVTPTGYVPPPAPAPAAAAPAAAPAAARPAAAPPAVRPPAAAPPAAAPPAARPPPPAATPAAPPRPAAPAAAPAPPAAARPAGGPPPVAARPAGGPPAAPPPAAVPAEADTEERGALMDAIRGGMRLRKAVTVDKSGPRL